MMRRLLVGFLTAAALTVPTTVTTMAAGTSKALVDSASAIETCIQNDQAWTSTEVVPLAVLTRCAPGAVVLPNATESLPPGEFIVPSSSGYSLQIDQVAPTSDSASNTPNSTQCADEYMYYISPPLYNLNLSGQVCWTGSVAWTNYITGSCSVWVPGVPGTSCGSYYTYEQGRNTYWDYPNGVFHELIYFFTPVCDHLYITNLGKNGFQFGSRYGC